MKTDIELTIFGKFLSCGDKDEGSYLYTIHLYSNIFLLSSNYDNIVAVLCLSINPTGV